VKREKKRWTMHWRLGLKIREQFTVSVFSLPVLWQTSLHILNLINVKGYWLQVIDFHFWCFNATFSNISAISWRPVLVLEEARVPAENHRPEERICIGLSCYPIKVDTYVYLLIAHDLRFTTQNE
jgi:hypothetical protein